MYDMLRILAPAKDRNSILLSVENGRVLKFLEELAVLCLCAMSGGRLGRRC